MLYFVGTLVATLSCGLQRLGPSTQMTSSFPQEWGQQGVHSGLADSLLKDTGLMEGCGELGSGPRPVGHPRSELAYGRM